MAASKLIVYNAALLHVEKEQIASLAANVEARFVLDRAWDGVVAEAFNEGDWNFAKKTSALTGNFDETPALNWTYVFDYPADYERTLTVSSSSTFWDTTQDFTDQSGFIHANYSSLWLRYISNASAAEVEKWPTMFWRYVALKLAFDTCGKLTSNSALKEELAGRLKKALRQAKSVDARNEPRKPIGTGSWLRARHGYPGSGSNSLGDIIVGGELVLGEGDV